jgi:hypothetical protein
MAAPIVSWRTVDNISVFSSWPIGTVDAGQAKPVDGQPFLVWNNRNGITDVSDMQNCTIITKDNVGGDTGELVINKWIQVKVVSLGESGWTPIGKNTPKTIRTNGCTTNGDGQWYPNVAPHAGEGTSYDILGVKNSDGGNPASGLTVAAGNYVSILARANVPSNAGAGTTNFKLRVAYQYV